MEPTIPTKSLVIVRKGAYHVGQPVSFVANGEVVTHRLVAINADGTITTKGDANETVDPWHPPASNIIGGVVAAPRQLGLVVYVLRQPRTVLGLLLLVVAVYLLWPEPRTDRLVKVQTSSA